MFAWGLWGDVIDRCDTIGGSGVFAWGLWGVVIVVLLFS